MISIAYAFVLMEEPKKKNPIGTTGKTVAANVKRLRESQRLTFTELAAILEGLGRTIPTLGLRHIEAEKRRVDADDLVALSVALGVSPITLLMPATQAGRDEVHVTAVDYPISAMTLWLWLRADTPMQGDDRLPFMFHADAWPSWWLRRHYEEYEAPGGDD